MPERTFGEPVKVAAKDGLEVQPITALQQIVGIEGPGGDEFA